MKIHLSSDPPEIETFLFRSHHVNTLLYEICGIARRPMCAYMSVFPASRNSTLVMLVVMLVERVFLVSGVVKTVFPPNKKK